MQLAKSRSDSFLESSTYSKVEGDPMELEANPGDLFELYFVLDNMRYHVERPVTPKSEDFTISYFNNLLDNVFRQMVRIDKRSFFHLVTLIKANLVFHNRSWCPQALVEC